MTVSVSNLGVTIHTVENADIELTRQEAEELKDDLIAALVVNYSMPSITPNCEDDYGD